MHQSGPNAYHSSLNDNYQAEARAGATMTVAAAAAEHRCPRCAFLVAYDPVHNASLRQPHPKYGRRHMRPVDHGSPVLADDMLLEVGKAHLDAITKRTRCVLSKL